MVALVRHRQTKESATDRLHLNHRATPRLHSAGTGSKPPPAALIKSQGRERRRKRPEKNRSGARQKEDRKGTTDDMSKRKRRCRNHGGFVTVGSAPAKTCLRTERHPALRWLESVRRQLRGTWEPGAAMRG